MFSEELAKYDCPADGITNDCWEKDSEGNYKVKYSDTIEGTIETVDRIKKTVCNPT